MKRNFFLRGEPILSNQPCNVLRIPMKTKLMVLMLFQLIASSAMAVTLQVTTTSDSGRGSLREVLTTINAAIQQESHHILFSIPLSDPGFKAETGSWCITPLTSLPTITRPVHINGCTNVAQASANTQTCDLANDAQLKIEIKGPGNVDSQNLALHGLVLGLGSDGSTIRGICINNFANVDGAGILVQSNGNEIQGCFIGTDITGMVSVPNTMALCNEGTDNLIGGLVPAARNLISGSYGLEGVISKRLGSLSIIGNTIGLNKEGTAQLAPESKVGINLGGGHFTKSTISGNVIAGNALANIYVNIFPYSAQLTIQGNKIGTDVSGTQSIKGNGNGIEVRTAPSVLSSLSYFEPIHIQENLISGNKYGIAVKSFVPTQARGTDVEITNNKIGLNAQESQALPNELDGILLDSSYGTIIYKNRICGNGNNGIRVDSSRGSLIQSNFIGVNSTTQPIPNLQNGIKLGSYLSANHITHDVALFDNRIAFNKEKSVTTLPSAKEVIMRNNILDSNLLHSGEEALSSQTTPEDDSQADSTFWFAENLGHDGLRSNGARINALISKNRDVTDRNDAVHQEQSSRRRRTACRRHR